MTLWQRLCYLFSLSFFCRVLILKFKFACSLLTLLMLHILLFQVFWAFSIYLEAVAILPQLVLLQRSGNVDNLTGQYVFFLGYASSPVNLATSWKDIILHHILKIGAILCWFGHIYFFIWVRLSVRADIGQFAVFYFHKFVQICSQNSPIECC